VNNQSPKYGLMFRDIYEWIFTGKLIRWTFTGNSKQDWFRAAPLFFVSAVFLTLLVLTPAIESHEWMEYVKVHIAYWLLLELLTLIVTPVLMWLFTAENSYDVPLTWRVVTLVFILLFLSPVYYKFVMNNAGLLLLYFVVRITPMFFASRPTLDDRQQAMHRLGCAFLFFMPGMLILIFLYTIFRGVINLELSDYVYIYLTCALYYFLMGGLELKLQVTVNWKHDARIKSGP